MYICFPGFIVQLRGLDDHSLLPGITLGDIGGTFGSGAAWIMVSCALTMFATQKKKCYEDCPLAYFLLAFFCLPNMF
jgi:ABC-type Mn2+/Zn2+ transport system permease subunit